MKFVLISDLHIDNNKWNWSYLEKTPNDVNTVVVAGDISNYVGKNCRFLANLKQRFSTVIWVAGNHDFYNIGYRGLNEPYTVAQITAHYKEFSEKNGIIFLDKMSYVHDGINFIGATGWHDYVGGAPFTVEQQIETYYKSISDVHIKWTQDGKVSHLNPLNAGAEDVSSITNLVNESSLPTVIITHHIPHSQLLWQKPYDPIWTRLHGCFLNSQLEQVPTTNVKLWIYGHTHQRSQKEINGITYICNARGYELENPSWEPIIIDI